VVPVTLVAGFAGDAKARSIARWLRERPGGERWAVLVDDFGQALAREGGPGDVDDARRFDVPGGCACCTAAVAMQATLGRVLRQGPWHRLLIGLSDSGDPAPLIDALRGPVLGQSLRVDGVFAVFDASRPTPWLDAASPLHALARAQLDAADVVVIDRGRPGVTPSPARLREALGSAPFGERVVLEAGPPGLAWAPASAAALAARHPGWPADGAGIGAGAGADDKTWAPLPRGGLFRSDPAGDGCIAHWWWPAQARFDRRALLHWADALRDQGLVAEATAVLRTERDWYRWRAHDARSAWAPTGWRRDNRVVCRFRAPVPPAWGGQRLADALAAG
jgi:hypothetical protein